jgi:hypothetical protein
MDELLGVNVNVPICPSDVHDCLLELLLHAVSSEPSKRMRKYFTRIPQDF